MFEKRIAETLISNRFNTIRNVNICEAGAAKTSYPDTLESFLQNHFYEIAILIKVVDRTSERNHSQAFDASWDCNLLNSSAVEAKVSYTFKAVLERHIGQIVALSKGFVFDMSDAPWNHYFGDVCAGEPTTSDNF